MTVHMTIELEESQEARIRALADARAASPEDVLKKMIAERLSYEEWFSAEVQKGLDSLAAGRTFTHEEVEERAAKRRAELLARSSG